MLRSLTLAALLAGVAMGGLPLHAQPASASVSSSAMPAEQGSADIQQVLARLGALGYQDVREIERKSDKLYEVKARDAQGRRVELYLDPRSGEVLQSEVKRRKWHD